MTFIAPNGSSRMKKCVSIDEIFITRYNVNKNE